MSEYFSSIAIIGDYQDGRLVVFIKSQNRRKRRVTSLSPGIRQTLPRTGFFVELYDMILKFSTVSKNKEENS
jgi:hypothetical protein